MGLNAQNINGKLTLNDKSTTELQLKTNSAVQLFKDFKTGKYQLKFAFDSKGVSENIYNKEIISKPCNSFWREKMLELGGDYSIWSNAPENPSYN